MFLCAPSGVPLEGDCEVGVEVPDLDTSLTRGCKQVIYQVGGGSFSEAGLTLSPDLISDGTESSKVGSTESKARRFTGLERISAAFVMHVK